MSFAISNYFRNFKQLNPKQKKTILVYTLLLNLFLLCSISFFGHKLHHIKLEEESYINERINAPQLNKADIEHLKGQIAVDTQIFMGPFLILVRQNYN